MRIIFAVLLAFFCVPTGGASGRVPDYYSLAGVPIRVFDLQAEGVAQAFREFMVSVPMTNARQVPHALIDDVVASLSVLKAATPPAMPAYFVAAYIQKTPFVAMADTERERYLQRYGEAVFPQRECPVFISRSGAGVSQLLGSAASLPAAYFEHAPGDAESFSRLFALTEVSHCGFIARELVHPTVIPPSATSGELRTLLEALGDFEASVVVRSVEGYGTSADEVDALFAARLLAMFLRERENTYTAVPALILEYQRTGIEDAHGRLGSILQSVRVARKLVRHALDEYGGGNGEASSRQFSLDDLERVLLQARATDRLETGDPLAQSLIAALGPATRLLRGDPSARVFPDASSPVDRRDSLLTLSGAISL
jgi:hypothetical protein